MEDASEPSTARNYDSMGAVAQLASSERYTTVMQVRPAEFSVCERS